MNELLLSAEAWLTTLRSEYLETFVRDGGCAVKVAVVDEPEVGAKLRARLCEESAALGYATAFVDAATCKVHLIDRFFNEIARQIDWDTLARSFLRERLLARGFRLPEDGSLDVHAIAAHNDQDEGLVLQDARTDLTNHLLRDYSLTKEFRLAVNQLCLALLEPNDLQRDRAQNIMDWLRGDILRIGLVREAFIYQKINRHTARTMLVSAATFARKAGLAGLVVLADISRYASGRRDDAVNRYSKPAALDMYETLRQFIDGTDDMRGSLLVFLTGPEFPSDEQRGMRAYNALHLRLADDVRDRRRANPLAPMVRIGGSTDGGG
jgi:P-loop Domain of unknown function (DUF2791)